MNCENSRNNNKDYLIFPYQIDILKNIFLDCSEITIECLEEKLQSLYFQNYFEQIAAKTIIKESHYIDKDYLEDFAGYYVRCFKPYDRYCQRLHFFNKKIDDSYFKQLLSGEIENFDIELKEFKESYLGFIVVKNLPKTIIGRTCLKTYKTLDTGRNFNVTRKYKANLFGIQLDVETLAFQEQDSVVAACATSSLWSMFHGTGKLFQHNIPSPFEITKIATAHLPKEGRIFPNNGLRLDMIAQAIQNIGLEPFAIKAQEQEILKATLYAYLKAKIPLLLAILLFDEEQNSYYDFGHAVAVTGYNLTSNDCIPYGITNFLLKSSTIDKIYVHDDQVGPFARMEFGTNIPVLGHNGKPMLNGAGDIIRRWAMSTSWGRKNGIDTAKAVPQVVLAPVYHKIRIPFELIHKHIQEFDYLIEDYNSANNPKIWQRIEWDIYLTTINNYKESILNENNLNSECRYLLSIKPYPKFLWRATAFSEDNKLFDLIFDATDIEQNLFLYDVISYNEDFCKLLIKISRLIYENRRETYANAVIRKFSEMDKYE